MHVSYSNGGDLFAVSRASVAHRTILLSRPDLAPMRGTFTLPGSPISWRWASDAFDDEAVENALVAAHGVDHLEDFTVERVA